MKTPKLNNDFKKIIKGKKLNFDFLIELSDDELDKLAGGEMKNYNGLSDF